MERKTDDTGKSVKIAQVMSLSKQERRGSGDKEMVLGEDRLLPHCNSKESRIYEQPRKGANVMG